jgi:hypothetical protein
LAKKRASKAATELHNASGLARKENEEAPRRIAVILSAKLAFKLKMQAYENHVTMQRYISDIVTNHLKTTEK